MIAGNSGPGSWGASTFQRRRCPVTVGFKLPPCAGIHPCNSKMPNTPPRCVLPQPARISRPCTRSSRRRAPEPRRQNVGLHRRRRRDRDDAAAQPPGASTRIAFRPRVLRDVSHIDTSVEVLGRKLALPVMLGAGRLARDASPRAAAPTWCGRRRVRRRPHAELGLQARPREGRRRRRPTRCGSSSSTCAATTPGSTTTSRGRSPTATRRSASRSTPRSTAGASATSPSAS